MLLLTVIKPKIPPRVMPQKINDFIFPHLCQKSSFILAVSLSDTHTHTHTHTHTLHPVEAPSILQIDRLQASTKGWQLLPQTAESAAADGNKCTSPHPLFSSNHCVHFLSPRQTSHTWEQARSVERRGQVMQKLLPYCHCLLYLSCHVLSKRTHGNPSGHARADGIGATLWLKM